MLQKKVEIIIDDSVDPNKNQKKHIYRASVRKSVEKNGDKSIINILKDQTEDKKDYQKQASQKIVEMMEIKQNAASFTNLLSEFDKETQMISNRI